MKAFKLRKYKFDLDEFQSHIDEVMTTKKQWLRAAPDKPDATWSYGIDDRLWSNIGDALDPSFIQKLSESVDCELYDTFWITDYKGCTELKMHKDKPGNEYPIDPRFTCIMELDGIFELPIWDDDQETLIDTARIEPGDILCLNFSDFYHSGRVVSGNKVSLHFYPKIPEIDGPHKNDFKLNIEDYF